jgi:predicted permease
MPVVIVMSIVVIGYILARKITIDHRSVSRLALYAFIPALVFKSTIHININLLELVSVSGVFFVLMAVLFMLNSLASRLLKLSSNDRSPFILSTSIGNVGNFGIPIVVFALGDEAGAKAVLIFVLSNIIIYTIGVYIASRGNMLWRVSLKTVFKMPVLYAAVIALVLNFNNIVVPLFILESVNILAGAAIPTMLVLLGMQLVNVNKIYNKKLLICGSVLKLIAAPLIAALLVNTIFKLSVDISQVFILLMAMPTAANINILALEFGNYGEVAAGMTFLTTIMSMVTIPVVIYLISLIV